ncbi:anti-sigma factor [Amycolatopsis sp. K13G38]|uniref:Regulator of SigK n=1 Tax=Amycolatopsis acididurans TaxID=2724524 RepID=A0ABX1JIC0_9PSEU|nr:anti-sigma factor [Amycolatopsis acididurans]NKQ58584.1 anti-sigma factor [Amycolatopsis acididurans]
MTTPDVHMLTGAYALDALDEFERRQFERHLSVCDECGQEVAELRATTVRLGLAVSQAPPAELKRRVMTQIAEVRQEPPGRERVARRRERRWAIRLVSTAAAVAVAVAAAFGVIAYRAQNSLDNTRGQLAQAQSQANELAELLAAPDLRAVPGTGSTSGEGSVMVSERLNRGMLLVHGMPDQPATATYQVWAIAGGVPRSIGLLGPKGTTTTPYVFEGLAGVNEVAMTVEPAGGSPRPTTSPSVWFTL